MKRIHNIHELIERRRCLRKFATSQEKVLWRYLRNKKTGFKFKRQHSIDYYIFDFFCAEKRLVIEVDGEYHDYQTDYDLQKDSDLEGFGFLVLRIKNEEIDTNIDVVMQKIESVLKEKTSP